MNIIKCIHTETIGEYYFVQLTIKRFLRKNTIAFVFTKYPEESIWKWVETGEYAHEFNDLMTKFRNEKQAIAAQNMLKIKEFRGNV